MRFNLQVPVKRKSLYANLNVAKHITERVIFVYTPLDILLIKIIFYRFVFDIKNNTQ
jgi:hypothetical protein